MKPRTFAVLLGVAMLITGGVLGVIGGSATVKSVNIFDTSIVDSDEVPCRSVFDGGEVRTVPLGANRADAQDQCDDAMSSRATWVWVLLGLGLVLTVGGALIKPDRLAR